MANRPKKYGGTSRGNDRDREEQGRQSGRGRNQESRRTRPGRTSEADIWEREESLGNQDQDRASEERSQEIDRNR